jgi:hypothetical protein
MEFPCEDSRRQHKVSPLVSQGDKKRIILSSNFFVTDLCTEELNVLCKTKQWVSDMTGSRTEKMVNGTQMQTLSSGNQGPCWDTVDTLGWGKAPGRAETSAPWTPSLWKASPHHNTLKEQAVLHPHTATACLPAHWASTMLARQATACCHARPLPYQPTGAAALKGLPPHQATAHMSSRTLPTHQPAGTGATVSHRRAPAPPDAGSKPA